VVGVEEKITVADSVKGEKAEMLDTRRHMVGFRLGIGTYVTLHMLAAPKEEIGNLPFWQQLAVDLIILIVENP
jgi:hypothetical protein